MLRMTYEPGTTIPPRPPQEGQETYAGLGFAIASLVLGIVGLTAIPVIPSILAIVFGYKARGEMNRSPGGQQARGLATAGLILGWVAIILLVLVVLVGALFLIPAGIATFGAGAPPLGG